MQVDVESIGAFWFVLWYHVVELKKGLILIFSWSHTAPVSSSAKALVNYS